MTRGQQPLPVRDDLRELSPYGAPQLDVAVPLNTNENPYPPSDALRRAIADAVAGVAGTLNRYPDRDATELRKDLAGYLGHGLTAPQLWAANAFDIVRVTTSRGRPGSSDSALGVPSRPNSAYASSTTTMPGAASQIAAMRSRGTAVPVGLFGEVTKTTSGARSRTCAAAVVSP